MAQEMSEQAPAIVAQWYKDNPSWGEMDYQDNIERVLCPKAGEHGHGTCGYCHECGAPNFCGCGCESSRGQFNESIKADRQRKAVREEAGYALCERERL